MELFLITTSYEIWMKKYMLIINRENCNIEKYLGNDD